jgi:hypothetical protein
MPGRGVALALLAASVACWPHAAAALTNNATFAPGWRAHIGAKAGDYAIRWSTAPDGRRAVRFELRAGDCIDNRVRDCETFRERAELRSVEEPPLGSERSYRYGVFVPTDFPEIGIDEIIGQFHDSVAPVLSTRHRNGGVSLVVQTRSGAIAQRTHVPSSRFAKGRWVTVETLCRWSREADGFCVVRFDGDLVMRYDGPTVTAGAQVGPYLKIGLYRSHLDRFRGGPTPTGVIYFTLPEISDRRF